MQNTKIAASSIFIRFASNFPVHSEFKNKEAESKSKLDKKVSIEPYGSSLR